MDGAIAIIPVGSVSKALCRELGQAVGDVLGRSHELLPSLGEPKYAFNPARSQYHSTAILRRVAGTMRPRAHAVAVGVVDVDLFLPDLNFVFGEADRSERAVVTSIARLEPTFYGRPADAAVTLRRAVAETLHELGHVFGLAHCQNDSCAMFFSNTLSDTDRKQTRFCDTCTGRLAKGLEV